MSVKLNSEPIFVKSLCLLVVADSIYDQNWSYVKIQLEE
jgi:hypothetical protein